MNRFIEELVLYGRRISRITTALLVKSVNSTYNLFTGRQRYTLHRRTTLVVDPANCSSGYAYI